MWATTFLSITPASRTNTPLLALGLDGWTSCRCERDTHQRPAWKKKKENEKVQRVEAVEAIIDLIARAREEEEQARERGHAETVEGLGRMFPYQSDGLELHRRRK